MKNLLQKRFLVKYIFVSLLFLPCLTSSQNILDNLVNINQVVSNDLIPISFDSNGSTLHGYFSKAHGEGFYPTIILLHGAPGGDRDVLGLAQVAPRAGWNALVFNYRGFYKSEGIYSLKNSLEDVLSALTYLKSDEIVTKYGVDTNHIALAGYSFGGSMALYTAANDPSIKYVISIAAADHGEIIRQIHKSDEIRSMIESMLDDVFSEHVRGPGGKEAVEELLRNSEKYDLLKYTLPLSQKSLLIIGALNDQSSTIEGHVLPLIRSLKKQKAVGLKSIIFDSDHSFEGKRTELADAVVSWLIDKHPSKKLASSAAQEELWNLEESYMLNYKDKNIEVLTEFWDENFIGWPEWAEEPVDVNDAKTALSKPSENKIISFIIRPQNMVLKGNIAVVYYLIDLNLENRVQEKSTATYRIIHTWINENGKWYMLGGMSTE